MEQLSFAQIQSALSAAFPAADIEWRLQWHNEETGLAVPFLNNRAIQNRLDEVVGAENWRNEYLPWHKTDKVSSQLCGVSIYSQERREWITKYDGAENTDVESVKGGLSDSMKRAAVQWGIGRYLYDMEGVWVEVEKKKKSVVIKDNQRAKLDKAYLAMLKQQEQPAKPAARPAAAGPERQAQPAAKPQSAKKEAPKPAANTRPVPAQAEQEYQISKVKTSPGRSGSVNTCLLLVPQEGDAFRAYIRGEHPGLIAGAKLKKVQLSLKQQDNVAYYFIDSYELAAATPPQVA